MSQRLRTIGVLGLLVSLHGMGCLAQAQTFVSGSTGSLGALAPATNTTVVLPADGILNYTTVTIPTGVTVTFQPNAANTPVILLATGDVLITGTMSVNGTAGLPASGSATVQPGGAGGPGGFRGGQGGARGATNNPASDGLGPGGGAATSTVSGSAPGTYGAPSGFLALVPLFGGSGGGGFKGDATFAGSSGGGGGGAMVIASSTKVTVNGSLQAKGGAGTTNAAGAGSGGAIRVVAPEVTGTGSLDVSSPANQLGRIRLEAFRMNFSGGILPASYTPSVSVTCGPVTTTSTPAVANLPTLTMTSLAGVATPSTPGGTYATADVSLAPGTSNPVSVLVTGTNIPPGTTFKVKHIPQFAQAAAPLTATSTGTLASSTATFNVTLPAGLVTVLNAYSEVVLP